MTTRLFTVVWSRLARARLKEIRAYIALDKPNAADCLTTRIVALVETLRSHQYLGRLSAEPDIRELVMAGTPYLIVYRTERNHVIIATIRHGSQNHPQ